MNWKGALYCVSTLLYIDDSNGPIIIAGVGWPLNANRISCFISLIETEYA